MEEKNLSQRFDALQDEILSLYEEENTDLGSQLRHWQLQRRSQAMLFYARKYGIKKLGLQPTPSLATSEANGKQAIEMTMLISSLLKSPFATESWTLQDTSAELVLHTAPKRTFKKLPYTVEVWFDNDASNSYEYANYRLLYTTDDNDQWYKTEGQTDYNGLYYIDANGDKAYFKLFSDEARLYSNTGTWTVRFNNHILSPPASSSRPPEGSSDIIVIESDEESLESNGENQYTDLEQAATGSAPSVQPQEETKRVGRGEKESSQEAGVQERRGGRQRESSSPPVKRAKADSTGGVRGRGARGGGTGSGGGSRRGGSAPTAAEVGGRHQTVATRGLTQLERLQAEARDPLIIIVQGPANCLKCWRYRLHRYSSLYEDVTTAFKWLTKSCNTSNSRILISFKSDYQRQNFLTFVKIPKHCTYHFGSLDAL